MKSGAERFDQSKAKQKRSIVIDRLKFDKK